ncbi:MAG: hypothetical protein ACRYFV_03895 [Janthinobacterium lividum]|jgi:hypothetical protein
MRTLVLLALSVGALLATTATQAHTQPLRPKVVHKLEVKHPVIVFENGNALPSMPELTMFAPKLIDYLQVEEQKPKWPREAVQPELEYDDKPLLAPPDSTQVR